MNHTVGERGNKCRIDVVHEKVSSSDDMFDLGAWTNFHHRHDDATIHHLIPNPNSYLSSFVIHAWSFTMVIDQTRVGERHLGG